MATTNINFDRTTYHGGSLRRWLENFKTGFTGLNEILSAMPHMIDGDGTDVAHFSEVVTRYGFINTAHAKAFWDELNSVMAKLNSDTSQTNVNAAIEQLMDKTQ